MPTVGARFGVRREEGCGGPHSVNDPVGDIVASVLTQWPAIGVGMILGGALDHYGLPVVIRVWIRIVRRDGMPRRGG